MFVTSSTTTGNIGGRTQADLFCRNDSGNPSDGAIFRALIMADQRNLSTNWVLKVETQYTDLDGTSIAQTAAQPIFDLDAGLDTALSLVPRDSFTGIEDDWTPSSDNCQNWTTSDPALAGSYGRTDTTDVEFIHASTNFCSQGLHLICVEQ